MNNHVDNDRWTVASAQVVAAYRAAAEDISDDELDQLFEFSVHPEIGGIVHGLHLAGKLRYKNYIVEINGIEIGLNESLFTVLCELVSQRLSDGPDGLGLTKIRPGKKNDGSRQQIIRRLRRTIDKAIAIPAVGTNLVRNADKELYFLDMPHDSITGNQQLLRQLARSISGERLKNIIKEILEHVRG